MHETKVYSKHFISGKRDSGLVLFHKSAQDDSVVKEQQTGKVGAFPLTSVQSGRKLPSDSTGACVLNIRLIRRGDT